MSAESFSYHLAEEVGAIKDDYRETIQGLADDGIEFIRVDLEAVGFPDEVNREFGDMAKVVRIEDVKESEILRPFIANIAQTEESIEDQYGVEVLNQTEAVSHGL